MSNQTNRSTFLALLKESLNAGSFVKATLSRSPVEYRWKRLVVSAFIDSKGTRRISFEYSDKRQVERSNVAESDAFAELEKLLTDLFRSAYLKTQSEEISFEHTDHDTFRLKRKILSGETPPLPRHNREKNYPISADTPFLIELGISAKDGTVKSDRYDKFRQIQKFIEIITTLIPKEVLSSELGLRAIDFGSGKHYLTFALHQFLRSHSLSNSVLGVEQREELVTKGRHVAEKLGCQNLEFTASAISSTDINTADLVVALHACDTATDDALLKAIEMKARYICVAPCCHQYVRQRLSPPPDLDAILRHGILAERFADGLTDSLRVLMLESLGYQTKLFEFIAPEHTAKNVMITAVMTGRPRLDANKQMRELSDKFGLRDFYLDLHQKR
jgi:hypothetical protein